MSGFFEMIGADNVGQIVSGLVRLLLAAICGAMIGVDREKRKRPAGLRTHMLVCLGAALVMLTNERIQFAYGGSDMTRMGAQVISGIGFLGAGTIIVDRQNRIRGLTTAAGLWTSACIGLAIGSGYYLGGLFACLLTVLIVVAFLKIEMKLTKKSRLADLYVEFESFGALYAFIERLIALEFKISSFNAVNPIYNEHNAEHAAANISLLPPPSSDRDGILQNLKDFEGLICMRDI